MALIGADQKRILSLGFFSLSYLRYCLVDSFRSLFVTLSSLSLGILYIFCMTVILLFERWSYAKFLRIFNACEIKS